MSTRLTVSSTVSVHHPVSSETFHFTPGREVPDWAVEILEGRVPPILVNMEADVITVVGVSKRPEPEVGELLSGSNFPDPDNPPLAPTVSTAPVNTGVAADGSVIDADALAAHAAAEEERIAAEARAAHEANRGVTGEDPSLLAAQVAAQAAQAEAEAQDRQRQAEADRARAAAAKANAKRRR